ncbi:MAG TPA: hypothetical protein PKI33_15855, partial [Anaerolineales bacterium]|nr:hypothetical protein [Anaerolineales bacterium]
ALLSGPLTGDVTSDRALIYKAFAAGHCFVGYDLPAPTKGFRFSAQGQNESVIMGDEISGKNGVTLQAKFPFAAEIILYKDGLPLQTWKNQQACTHITTEPGVYRVEAYRNYLGKRRGWIYSNPIYVK